MSAGICHHFQSETNLRCWLRERPLAMSRRFFFHRTESHQAAKLRSTFPQLTYHAMTCLHKVISRHIPIHRKFFIMNFWSVIGFSSSQIRKTSAETESGKWFFPFSPFPELPAALNIKRISYRWRIHQIFNNRNFSFFSSWRQFFLFVVWRQKRFFSLMENGRGANDKMNFSTVPWMKNWYVFRWKRIEEYRRVRRGSNIGEVASHETT